MQTDHKIADATTDVALMLRGWRCASAAGQPTAADRNLGRPVTTDAVELRQNGCLSIMT